MGSLVDQVLALLSSDAGSLMYHLVLAFSVAGTLQISLNQSQRYRSLQIRRILLGVSLLMLLQLGLFVASGLVWQAVVDGRIWLPLLERSVSLLSLVLIVWLWSFPNPDQNSNSPSSSRFISPADSATLFIGILILAGSIFGSIWWVRQNLSQVLNGSMIDLAFQIACICVAVIGLLNLAILRPALWGYGIAMMLLLGAGPVVHLLLLPYGQDYPSITRLFEIAAFPFLLLLPGGAVFQTGLDFSGHPEESAPLLEPGVDADQQVIGLLTDESLWKPLFNLMGEVEPSQVADKAAAILARTGQADLALIALPPKPDGKIEIIGGYDGRNKRYLPIAKVESSTMPVLISCLKMGRVRRLAAESTAPDIACLSKIFKLEQIGNILLMPVLQPDGKPLAGVVLIAPDAQKDWSPKEQSNISLLSKLLVQFLQRMQETASLKTELDQARQSNRATQEQAQLTLEEKLKLRDQLTVLQESARRDQEQIMSMAALVANQTSLQSTLEQMKAENERLKENIRQAMEDSIAREKPLGGELRLALEEIAILRTAVAEAESEIANLEVNPVDASPSSEQLATIQSISQDLRQPLSSIVGYTDLLLGESIGILGATQRKYLERIKLSATRFSRLIDDLVQTSMVESNPTRIEHEEIDVCAVIQTAMKEANRTIQMKRVALKSSLPDQPLKIISDRNALHRVLTLLLQNAGSVTPEGAEMGITARLESSENKLDFVLVQVSDRGGGIAAQDIPRVFTPRSKEVEIQGLGKNNVDFLRLKTLIEVLGGRTWVDSEPGQGATFSILLPAVPDQSNGKETQAIQ
jgi:signal transduction histidine kinase